MDKHPKPIDANKILNDLNEHIGSLNNDLEYATKEGEESWASEISNKIELLSLFVDGIASGRYKIDPIPLPTIKPGYVVKHKRFKSCSYGTVKSISESGKRALVKWDNYNMAYYELNSLEVISHDQG